jgi:hypothetical protein
MSYFCCGGGPDQTKDSTRDIKPKQANSSSNGRMQLQSPPSDVAERPTSDSQRVSSPRHSATDLMIEHILRARREKRENFFIKGVDNIKLSEFRPKVIPKLPQQQKAICE